MYNCSNRMPNQGRLLAFRWAAAGLLAVNFVSAPGAQQALGPASELASSPAQAPYQALISAYCVTCHNNKTRAGGLELDAISTQALGNHWDVWEKVDRKLRARQMPPPGARRPDEAVRTAALDSLEAALDKVAAAAPNPGRTETFRRLNRTEYQNAIRDLLALESDAASAAAGRFGQLRFRQHYRRQSVADLVGKLCHGG